MTPADVDAAREILRSDLARSVVYGSFGLLLHGVRDAALVPDVDVIADDAPAMGRALLARGFTVCSWQDELRAADLTAARLAGRIYLRARRGALCIDVTYEGLDLAEWRGDARAIEGITVATIARIERQRAIKAGDSEGVDTMQIQRPRGPPFSRPTGEGGAASASDEGLVPSE